MFFPVPPQPKEAAVNNKRHDDKQSRRVRAVVEGGGVHSIGKTNRAAADPHSNMPPGSSRSSLRRGGQWSPFDEGIRTSMRASADPRSSMRASADPRSSMPSGSSRSLLLFAPRSFPNFGCCCCSASSARFLAANLNSALTFGCVLLDFKFIHIRMNLESIFFVTAVINNIGLQLWSLTILHC
jgi:hypothetical protein